MEKFICTAPVSRVFRHFRRKGFLIGFLTCPESMSLGPPMLAGFDFQGGIQVLNI